MLSYQHAYHAGGPADVHKHDLLSRALTRLAAQEKKILYIETHAGRGRYDLTAAPALKTGEAEAGWLARVKAGSFEDIAPGYLAAVKAVNEGKLAPLYPGSPLVAAHLLRRQDSSLLFELHPAEHAALEKTMAADTRARVIKRDGMQGALDFAKTQKGARQSAVFLLVDPSYEIKSEYETVPDFARAFHNILPRAEIMIWAPMLPAGGHETLKKKITVDFPGAKFSEQCWADPSAGRGMYGSLVVHINAPAAANPAKIS